jgi:hypothetical protein
VPGSAHDDRPEQLTGDAAVVRDAFEQLPVVLMALDGPDHRLAAMNAAYRAVTGRSGVIGVAYRDAFPELAGPQVYELLDRVYATGEAETGVEWRARSQAAAAATIRTGMSRAGPQARGPGIRYPPAGGAAPRPPAAPPPPPGRRRAGCGGRDGRDGVGAAGAGEPVQVPRRLARYRVGLPGRLEQPPVGEPHQDGIHRPSLDAELRAQVVPVAPAAGILRQRPEHRDGLRRWSSRAGHSISLYNKI